MGNSLGGHIALLYTLRNPEKVEKMVLTGSSGLFENSMGGSFPKRGDYEYIKERVGYTFYNPNTATKELIDEIFETTNNIPKCLRIVAIAKSAQRNNMASDLPKIQTKTLLVWGLNDTITPPVVGHEFNRLLSNSQLRFIDKCCHAPMMEQPDKFNSILEEFI
jgi:pimeloyl-ACP methyl ester carboxylesterase